MKLEFRHFPIFIILIASQWVLSCTPLPHGELLPSGRVNPSTLAPSSTFSATIFDESIIASPLLDFSQGKALLIVPASDGVLAALDAENGAMNWQITVPTPEGRQPQLVATPKIVGDKLVVLYQSLEQGERTSHHLAVVDLTSKQLDDDFPILVLAAEQTGIDGKSTVKFNSRTAFSHAALQHAIQPGAELGTIYAAFGNAGDTQPFHGWLFEIDLDAWKNQGVKQAISNVLVTTPEADCPVTIQYGTQEMICGGGIWVPAGPQIFPVADSYEILVPTGNGQVNPTRRDYANSVMRLAPGLKFDSGCDMQQCSNFNAANPDEGCLSSCKNVFMPRLASENPPFRPADQSCNGKSFWECLAWMDYDLGANAPVKTQLEDGRSVLVQPGKDGGVYLIDAEHLGLQYDRLQIADICGTLTDPCKTPWAGMIVTQPVLSVIDDDPVVVIPTFVPDNSHPAGLVALKIVTENGLPKFKRFWRFPDPASRDAVKAFRSHPSLPVLSLVDGDDEVVWIVDIGLHGTVYGIRLKDGKLLVKQSMQGTGRPLTTPLIHGSYLYMASTQPDTNKGFIESFKIGRAD